MLRNTGVGLNMTLDDLWSEVDGEVKLQYIAGTENPADILTKSLPKDKFVKNLDLTGLKPDAVKYQ